MKLVHVPWVTLLLAGIVFLLASDSTVDFVIGSVMALSGFTAWMLAVKQYRGEQQHKDIDHP